MLFLIQGENKAVKNIRTIILFISLFMLMGLVGCTKNASGPMAEAPNANDSERIPETERADDSQMVVVEGSVIRAGDGGAGSTSSRSALV